MDSSTAFYLNSSRSDEEVQGAMELLERHSDFMNFFFQHICACPPHGPFRHYCVLTFIERAKHRYDSTNSGTVLSTMDESSDAITSHLFPQAVSGLIDKYYTSAHLRDWPLLYVPGEVRLADVDALIEAQKATQQ